jgi:hypothetical protein
MSFILYCSRCGRETGTAGECFHCPPVSDTITQVSETDQLRSEIAGLSEEIRLLRQSIERMNRKLF